MRFIKADNSKYFGILKLNQLLKNKDHLLKHTSATLNQNIALINGDANRRPVSSSVLFLMGEAKTANGASSRPFLILNKRSGKVPQPGDLCFPGGGAVPGKDAIFARLLSLPGFPFARWRSRAGYLEPDKSDRLARLLATCLRESFEEMGLLPLAVRFLGPLPHQRLIMFKRSIYPMVGWVGFQKHFRLNGEVDKIVHIPIDSLLDPENYARFQLTYPSVLPPGIDKIQQDFPCFVQRQGGVTEILWGATYRIVMTFLDQVFGFTPPEISGRARIENNLSPDYFNHSRNP